MCLGREIVKSVSVGCMDSDRFLCGCERCVCGDTVMFAGEMCVTWCFLWGWLF